jgi:hypothetical protein
MAWPLPDDVEKDEQLSEKRSTWNAFFHSHRLLLA